MKLLPIYITIICTLADAHALKEMGFSSVLPIEETLRWNDLTLHRQEVKHRSEDTLEQLGEVAGFIMEYQDTKPSIGLETVFLTMK
ncbi:hypothetical protein OAT16_02810 [Prolixibacteraceae bacterium]|nr:hypothetical protein [Prolixibacteraceae bacterium]